MDFCTEQLQESVEQIATVLSDLVTTCVQDEARVGIGQIGQGMRQIFQEVGRLALGQVLEKSDQVEPSIRCGCNHKAAYRCRREGMVISVFGRVRYRPSYYLCDYCRRGTKPLDTKLKIKPDNFNAVSRHTGHSRWRPANNEDQRQNNHRNHQSSRNYQ